jgi:hypothetical protein
MKRAARKLSLNRETLRRLDGTQLRGVRGAAGAWLGTLTYEGSCGESETCPPPETGCTASTLSCTQ